MNKPFGGALAALCALAFGGQLAAQTPPASVQNASGIYVPVGVEYCLNCSGGGGGGGGTVFETAGGFADLTTIISSLSTLNGSVNSLLKTGQSITVSNLPATQAISAVALPLPAGAATAANQAALSNGSALESGGNLAGAKADLDALAGAISGATPQGLNFTGYVDLQNGGNNLTITASGAAKVDGSGVTQPVSITNPAVSYSTAFAGGAINITTAATTQLVTASGATLTYITHLDVEAGGTGNFTLEYGTGTLCGTGTVALTGPYALTAQSGLAIGTGAAPVLKPVPASNNVCAVTSAAVQISGSILASQQ